MVKRLLKKGIKVLQNPEKEFGLLNEKNLESVVFDYLRLLIFIAFVAAMVNFIINLARVVYLDFFLLVKVNYIRFLNYAFGQASAVAIIYIIAGTFIIFFLGLILRIFFSKMKFTELLKKLLYAMMPILLFGWTPTLGLGLLIWSIFLFVIGIKFHKKHIVKKSSIEQRD